MVQTEYKLSKYGYYSFSLSNLVRTGPALPKVGKATALAIYGCGHSASSETERKFLGQITPKKWMISGVPLILGHLQMTNMGKVPPINGGLDGRLIYKHVPFLCLRGRVL